MRPAPILTAAVLSLSLSALAAHPGLAQGGGGDPRAFVEDALRGDNSEMMLGKLAASKGTTAEVRDYGRTLNKDHAHARDMTLPVAREVGADIKVRPSREASLEEEKLEQTYGRAFDREFARYMVADHKRDIAEFEDQARRGGPAGRLAQNILPDLHKHLDMAERLRSGEDSARR